MFCVFVRIEAIDEQVDEDADWLAARRRHVAGPVQNKRDKGLRQECRVRMMNECEILEVLPPILHPR